MRTREAGSFAGTIRAAAWLLDEDKVAHQHPGDPEPRPIWLLMALTAGAAVLVVATLPLAAAPGSVSVGVAWTVGGAGAVVAVYLALPRLAWLPFVPAAATVAALIAVSGGSASPYRALLLVLLAGAATLPSGRDVLFVSLLVAVTLVSPFVYEPSTEYGLVANGIEVISWALAAVLVWRVAGNLRTARRHIVDRTRLVSAVLGSLPQQAAVVDASGRIVLTNDAWDRAHRLGLGEDADPAADDYQRLCRTRRGAAGLAAAELEADLRDVLAGSRPTAVSELSWEMLAGELRWFTVRTTCLPDGLGAVVTHEDITPLIESEHARQVSLERSRELEDRKRALLRAVSHDVRTPLTVISGVTGTLQRSRHRLGDADIEKLLDGLEVLLN